MADSGEEEKPKRKKKGETGLPTGVHLLPSGRFQGRVSYLPSGATKKEQRGVGTYDTAAEAAEAIAAVEARLAAGEDPWDGKEVQKRCHRGEVRSQHAHTRRTLICLCVWQAPEERPRKTERRWGVHTTETSREANERRNERRRMRPSKRRRSRRLLSRRNSALKCLLWSRSRTPAWPTFCAPSSGRAGARKIK